MSAISVIDELLTVGFFLHFVGGVRVFQLLMACVILYNDACELFVQDFQSRRRINGANNPDSFWEPGCFLFWRIHLASLLQKHNLATRQSTITALTCMVVVLLSRAVLEYYHVLTLYLSQCTRIIKLCEPVDVFFGTSALAS